MGKKTEINREMNRETKRTCTQLYRFHKFISSSSFPIISQLNQNKLNKKNKQFVCLSICQPWPLWAGRQGKPSIWRLDKKHWVFGRILLSRSTDPTQALCHRASITFCQLRATSFEPESNNILHWRNKTSNEGFVQSKSTVITDVCTVCTWLARVIASLWLSIVLVMVHIHSKDGCLSFYILHLTSVALNLIWCQGFGVEQCYLCSSGYVDVALCFLSYTQLLHDPEKVFSSKPWLADPLNNNRVNKMDERRKMLFSTLWAYSCSQKTNKWPFHKN